LYGIWKNMEVNEQKRVGDDEECEKATQKGFGKVCWW
jgi:hypothetical protein